MLTLTAQAVIYSSNGGQLFMMQRVGGLHTLMGVTRIASVFCQALSPARKCSKHKRVLYIRGASLPVHELLLLLSGASGVPANGGRLDADTARAH